MGISCSYLLKLNCPAVVAAVVAAVGPVEGSRLDEADTDGCDGDMESCFCDADSAAEVMSASIPSCFWEPLETWNLQTGAI